MNDLHDDVKKGRRLKVEASKDGCGVARSMCSNLASALLCIEIGQVDLLAHATAVIR